jgi:hypothetical protein
MKTTWKSLGVALAAAALAFSAPVAAQATTVFISGSFVGGGTVSGNISFGSGLTFDLTTTGGPYGGFTYTSANPLDGVSGYYPPPTFSINFTQDVGEPSTLHLALANDLFSESDGNTDPLLSSSYECVNSFVCPNSEAQFAGFSLRNVVPEPATWALLMMGVGAIGAGLRFARKTQTNSANFA